MTNKLNNKLNFYPFFIIVLTLGLVISNNDKIKAQSGHGGLIFQALARDSYQNPAINKNLLIQSSIIQGSKNGFIVYMEEHTTLTDATGVFTVSVGLGNRVGGTKLNLMDIDWANGPYYLNMKISIPSTGEVLTSRNWIDLGTTIFGVVPYALNIIGGSKPITFDTSSFNLKLNIADTSTMLSKRIGRDTINLSKRINNKLNLVDTADMFNNRFGRDTISLSNRINLKANTTDLNAGLSLKANTIDFINGLSNKVDKIIGKELSTNDYTNSEKTKLASITGSNTGDQDLSGLATISNMDAALLLKENTANKSIDVNLGGSTPNDILYPTQKAVKIYIDGQISSGGVSDGSILTRHIATSNITTSLIADASITDIKLAMGINKTKVGLGNVENTKLSTWNGSNQLNQLGTITSGVWSGTTIALSNGGTGATNAFDARNTLGLSIGTDVQAALTPTQIGVISNTSGINTGDETAVTIKTKLGVFTLTGINTGDQDLSAYATTANLALKASASDVTTSLALKADAADLTSGLATKVDKVTGKDLSTNDYTSVEKTKLANITGSNTGDETAVTIRAKLGVVTLTGVNTGDQDLSSYATTTNLALKANSSDVTSSLALKANASDVTTSLALKADATDLTNGLALKANLISPTLVTPTLGVATATSVSAGTISVTSDIIAKRYKLTMPSTITAAATTTIDLSAGNIFTVSLGVNVTTLTLTNPAVGTYLIKFVQDATGSRDVTFPAAWKWSGGITPNLTNTGGKLDIVTLIYDGTTFYATIVSNF